MPVGRSLLEDEAQVIGRHRNAPGGPEDLLERIVRIRGPGFSSRNKVAHGSQRLDGHAEGVPALFMGLQGTPVRWHFAQNPLAW